MKEGKGREGKGRGHTGGGFQFQMSSPNPNPPSKSAATRMAWPSPMTTRASVMTKARALECAVDAHVLLPGEYPFVKRFRLRRLLAFLWRQGCCSTFVALLKQTKVFFCVDYLAQFVSKGKWTEALDYLVPRFLPAVPQSMEGRILVLFLSQHRSFHLEVVRRKLRVDMRPVWAKAAGIVRDLATRTPELKDRLLLPADPMGSQNVLPIGFGFAPFRRRCHVKKHRPPKSSAVAKLYLHKRSSLPSSSHSNQELSPAEFQAKALDLFRGIKKESIEALIRLPKLNQGCGLQSSVREGAPVAPVCHAMFGDGINSAENSATSLVAKTGGAAISQTMLGTMSCPENSEVISASNDGTGQEVCYTGSAYQGSYPKKRPMTEQQEDYLDIKKQRTAGVNGEASTPILHIMEGEDTAAAGPPASGLQTKIAELLPVTE